MSKPHGIDETVLTEYAFLSFVCCHAMANKADNPLRVIDQAVPILGQTTSPPALGKRTISFFLSACIAAIRPPSYMMINFITTVDIKPHVGIDEMPLTRL